MPLGYEIYTLYVQGRYYEVILTGISEESSKKYSENPFIETLKLVSIRLTPKEECETDEQIKIVEEALKTESAKHFSDHSVIKVLKEALNIYGLDGMEGPYGLSPRNRVTNIITKLKV